VLRCAQREAFVQLCEANALSCNAADGVRGHTSLERELDYDTDRNEVYGFVDVAID
jgi:hypothetical protein